MKSAHTAAQTTKELTEMSDKPGEHLLVSHFSGHSGEKSGVVTPPQTALQITAIWQELGNTVLFHRLMR